MLMMTVGEFGPHSKVVYEKQMMRTNSLQMIVQIGLSVVQRVVLVDWPLSCRFPLLHLDCFWVGLLVRFSELGMVLLGTVSQWPGECTSASTRFRFSGVYSRPRVDRFAPAVIWNHCCDSLAAAVFRW